MHILASWSANNAHTQLPRSQDASFPGTWYQPTWPLGTWYLAVWSNTSSRARPSGPSGRIPLVWGEHRKSSKIVICWFHAATQPKCHQSILFANICTMLAWHQKHLKIDILASQNRYFRSLSAHLGFLECQNAHTELPRSQDAGFPGILVPRYLASRYLVSGSME